MYWYPIDIRKSFQLCVVETFYTDISLKIPALEVKGFSLVSHLYNAKHCRHCGQFTNIYYSCHWFVQMRHKQDAERCYSGKRSCAFYFPNFLYWTCFYLLIKKVIDAYEKVVLDIFQKFKELVLLFFLLRLVHLDSHCLNIIIEVLTRQFLKFPNTLIK